MRIGFVIFFVLLLSGCEKSEVVTVTDNQAPPDGTISNVTVENYINKSYILVLGREPSSAEFNSAKTSLINTGLDSASRAVFITSVINAPDYRPHIYDLNKIDLLNNTDTSDFTNWITIFSLFLQDSTYLFQWPALQYELNRMTQLRSAYSAYVNGSIDLAEVQRRMCNNYIYDQINMGSANFVISSFQHLINRNPTRAEQTAGVSMVDGNNAILFLTAGNSKTDYLNILTGDNNYYEGQIARMYIRYLQRNPNTIEMVEATTLFGTSGSPDAVLKKILTTDEFIGL